MKANLVKMTKSGPKVVQQFNKIWLASKAIAAMDAKEQALHSIHPVAGTQEAAKKGPKVKTQGKPQAADLLPSNPEKPQRVYRQSTLAKIQRILERGQATPKYAVYAQDEDGKVYTVGVAATKSGARYLRRKARGFCKRVLQQVYRFKITKA